MNDKCKNPSIRCTVTSCRNHLESENYCGLDCIQVGTHEPHPTEPQCVDCNSFEVRGDSAAC